ncbi:ARM repeat-containing protein [Suhomyces tanzawaensis NRRL Y-17324]|uniref:Importin-95 n=1 Tax=Suhomyces tanzawaensis NRRL Y-17324 TaxID=984487 RepID=A0A1E4SJ34_9ASCO|nr:ARM repeat-containing protein [Suhomyces tanzawaensis NRRL Y-17324]ODV79500.1 ARM repeat-containing protein [Suhomyces tanzawaensis NRRL Y-17324]
MEMLQILENAILNPDPNKRTEAELKLAEASNNHFPEYMNLLADAVANQDAKREVRMLAAIGLKNQLTSKEDKNRIAQAQRWAALNTELKQKIKDISLKTLGDSDDKVGASSAQLVAAIANIELPKSEWPDLIPIIIENTKPENSVNLKKTSHTAIGYICENADPNNPAIIAQANGILIAIIQGVQSSETSKEVSLAALNALFSSLDFIKHNFEKEGERNYIMQVVCEATQADDNELQASAFGCLARIMSLYYRYMSLYMEKALYGLTVSGMQSDDEKVACMAVEFWSTVCEEELEVAYRREDLGLGAAQTDSRPDLVSYNFALVAIQDVLPTLLTLLTRQNEDPEDDDWSVAMAAGACLQLFAQNVGNYIVEPTVHFVAANIADANSWRNREAAVMAFGSILENPDIDNLKDVIPQALQPILGLINDDVLQVKETVAWCLGRIADLVIAAIDPSNLPAILEALVTGLQDHPKVSTNCCWALINILEKLCPNASFEDSSVMSPFYATIVPILIQLTGKNDNEFSSRASAYEALSTFVTHSANDTMPVVQNIATEVLSRLETTISMQSQVSNSEDRGNLEELQINILSLLTNVIRRLSNDVAQAADNLMSMFLKLLSAQEKNSLIEEDIFIAISAVAGAVGSGFNKYMGAFLPYLTQALQNTDSPTCNTAVGLVADLSQSLGLGLMEYLDGLMNILGANLNNAEVRKELRPAILSCFGDVATSIGSAFQPYLDIVMQICIHASQIEPEDQSIEAVDYVLNVKESVLDCFVGIVGGLGDHPAAIHPYIGAIFQFLERVASDINMSATDAVCRSATGLLGDLAAMYPQGEFKQAYLQPWITEFIKKTRSNQYFEDKTREAARWARDQQKKQMAL